MLDAGARSVKDLSMRITKMKETSAEKLQSEYQKLVEGLKESKKSYDQSDFLANPILPADVLNEAVPGNIRQAEHFIGFLRRFIEYIKVFPFLI